jgi:hypothetical protein
MIVASSEKFMNIWEIPFPAVTLCPDLDPRVSFRDEESGKFLFSKLTAWTEIVRAKWVRLFNDPKEMFKKIATDEGICYTFNVMNFHDMFKDDV